MRGKLLGRGQALGTLGGDAGAHLRPQTGDAHHEEFVEVVGRDRQEPQPLEQRMAAVGGFLEHAPVEIEPGELAVDETFRARGNGRLGMTARRLGEARRAPPAPAPGRIRAQRQSAWPRSTMVLPERFELYDR